MCDLPIVAGMTSAELVEFKKWLRDCCGDDFELMDRYERAHAASCWYDEQFEAANPEYFAN